MQLVYLKGQMQHTEIIHIAINMRVTIERIVYLTRENLAISKKHPNINASDIVETSLGSIEFGDIYEFVNEEYTIMK